jgi:large repetitive protein
MFRKMSFWGASKRRSPARNRRNSGLRFEPLESRQLLAVLTPNPIVSAGLVGNDLVINGSAPEIHIKITETAGVVTVEGLTRDYLGTDGDVHTVQTDVNNSGTTSVDFTPTSLRDLKIKLSGDDSILEVGDLSAPVIVGRDLIVSMAASTTDANLIKAGIDGNSHLCIDIDSTTVARNLTITTGNGSNSEAAVIDITNDLIGSATLKGVLTIKTYGDVPNMIGLSTTVIVGDASVTTAAGDDLIAVVGADLTGRLTISAGAGDNTVLATDNFIETIDSSLQTFVTNNPMFGDGQDDELTDECVADLANDLNVASSLTVTSFTAQNANIYTLGGNDLIDVHDAIITGGNLVVSAGGGTNVVAVTETTVASTSNSSAVGNATITSGAGDDLVILISLDVSGRLYVNTGAGSDTILATPDVGSGVVDSAIVDFVALHPGVFFDPSTDTGTLDIENLRGEIRDIIDDCGFEATKADFVTKDVAGEVSRIDIALSVVTLDMTVTMGNGDDGLAISEVKVGHDATLKTGNGADTIIVVGLGGLVGGSPSVREECGPPLGEMNHFLLTTGNGDNTVVISLDWMGEPGYVLGDYGIGAAMESYIAAHPDIAGSLYAVTAELDAAAEALLDSTTPYSLDAHRVDIRTGSGADRVTLSDICISPSTTDRLFADLGAGNDILFFYDNCWDGFANLNGGLGDDTLDEHRGGNTENNLTVTGFETVIPEFII